MTKHAPLLILLLALALSACDEVPTDPDVPDTFRVVLVTATTGGTWYVYEIDEEGETRTILESSEPLRDAVYTSLRGTQGAIAYHNADDELVVRHLETGNENVVGRYPPATFSIDGTLLAYASRVDSAAADTARQVFVFNRGRDFLSQVTENECAAAQGEEPDYPCARSASSPVFGELNEVFLLRTLVHESGATEFVAGEVDAQRLERRFITVSADTMALTPRSYFENTLLVDYEKRLNGEPERGYYAVEIVSGAHVRNRTNGTHSSFCHDGSVAVLDGTFLRFLEVGSADEIDRLSLPGELGTDILEVRCSVRPREKPAR